VIGSLAAQCASLANDYGATHGPNSPTSFEVALLIVDDDTGGLVEVPTTTDVEDEDTGVATTVANGYARATVANDSTTFPAPDPATGVLTTPPIIGFPASTAEYPGDVVAWALYDGGVLWDWNYFATGQRITVSDAGIVPMPVLSIYYNDKPLEG
jgi:hypothetical protein